MKEDQPFRQRLIAAYVAGRTERTPSVLVEEQLYDALPGSNDEARMVAFHEASWPEVVSIVLSFDDPRLPAFGLRLIYFGSRSSLPAKLQAEVEHPPDRPSVGRDRGRPHPQSGYTGDRYGVGRPGVGALLADYRTHLNDRILRVTRYRSTYLAVS